MLFFTADAHAAQVLAELFHIAPEDAAVHPRIHRALAVGRQVVDEYAFFGLQAVAGQKPVEDLLLGLQQFLLRGDQDATEAVGTGEPGQYLRRDRPALDST